MAKPTDFQKRVIEAAVNEIRYWDGSNDIHSPSHGTSIEHDMFSNLNEYDFGLGPKDPSLALIADKVRALWAEIAYLEPSGR